MHNSVFYGSGITIFLNEECIKYAEKYLDDLLTKHL